jgi:hypothetical protein
LDAQNVLWVTGRVALWTVRGASDRNIVAGREGPKTKVYRGSHGWDDRRQWDGV